MAQLVGRVLQLPVSGACGASVNSAEAVGRGHSGLAGNARVSAEEPGDGQQGGALDGCAARLSDVALESRADNRSDRAYWGVHLTEGQALFATDEHIISDS